MRLRRIGIPLLLAVFALFGGLLSQAPPAAAKAVPPPVANQKPVPVHKVQGKGVRIPAVKPARAPKVSWPATATATVTPGSSATRAGSTPVSVKAIPKTAAPGPVRVSVKSRQAASAVGIPGMVFTVGHAPVSGTAKAGSAVKEGKAQVSVSYASFAGAYGGDYGSRLRLVELPACALTTPQKAKCRKETPLPTANDVKSSTLSAEVPLAAGTAAAPLATAPSPSGSGGDYTATKLTEAGSWTEGGNSGAFTYSYPISVPAVPGGLQPTVALGYNSQTVDGLTSSTNNQASEIGDGWDYDPGSISRSYVPCSSTSALSPAPSNSPPAGDGDLCDSSYETTTLNLNGTSTRLVQDDSTGDWHLQDDDGATVAFDAAGPSGSTTAGAGYWVITETDGTKYYFGMNLLPGGSASDETDSAWTVPVYATSSGQPCYKAAFADSVCSQAWQWNLDYVVDTHGDAESYFYKTETNYYAQDGATSAPASSAYVQGGALKDIEYGFRAGGAFSGAHAGEVDFTTAESRTDIPTASPNDLACASGAACQVGAPTFWSRYQLESISTKAAAGTGGALSPVDSWALSQCHEATTDKNTSAQCQGVSTQPMWLRQITQTGEDGGSVSLPPVTFTGTSMQNLSGTSPSYDLIPRDRLSQVENETGGVTTVEYSTADTACSQGNYPAPDANTDMCYPDWWTDDITTPSSPSTVESWFNKYSVLSVTETDETGGDPEQVTKYTYTGPAWHYTEDPTVPSAAPTADSATTDERTWDEWRGFRTVTTETGASPDAVTRKVDTYLQGMDGDYQSDGGTSSVSVSDGHGDTVPDSGQFQGDLLEDVVYDGTGDGDSGKVVTDTATVPWSGTDPTASQAQPKPMPALQAFHTGTKETRTFTALASGGTRESDTVNDTFDSYGRVTQSTSVPDTSDTSQDTCTSTSYADNADEGILDLPKEVKVTAVPCGTSPSYPADAISDTLTYYDGATDMSSGITCDGTSEPADTPCAGNVTETQLATSYDSNGNPVYTTQSTGTFDEYGRPLTAADADNRTTKTTYAPATGAEPSQETVTDPQGLQTVTTYDQARELPLTTTSPAGLTTTETYDALGRLSAVWTPGNATSGPASVKFAYTVSQSAPSYTVTSTLDPDASGYLDSVTVYDSLGQAVEDQEQQPSGGWDLSDTSYDSNGKASFTQGPYYAGDITEGSLVEASKDDVPDQTATVYDGAGRTTESVAEDKGTETWETDTVYGGDYTTTSYKCSSSVPECGGTASTTLTDGRGLTTAIYQYHAGATADPSDPASDYDKTSYTYFPSKKLKTITDAVGNQWSYTYDLSGNELTDDDPDAGKTTDSYDAANQLMSTTDARNKTVSFVYDQDSRKTAEYDTTGDAQESSSSELASWTYDTLAKGQLTSASSYYGGQAFTEKTLGYNAFGEPTGTEVTIPSSQGALAGTYITEDKAYAKTGELESYEDSAAGNLPAETVNYTYDSAGDPTSVQGISSYVGSLSYDELGDPQQYTMGSSSQPAYVTDSYDPQTGALADQQTDTGTTPSTVDDIQYGYNNTGDVLWENDQPSGASASAQSQCFKYDYLSRLVTAWSQGSACTASSTPSASAEGEAAAPYWDTYQYSSIGNLTGQTSEQPDGTVTTTANTFPAAGSAQPHAATAEVQVGGSTGTTSNQYDAAGHETSTSGDTVTGTIQSQSLTWDDAGRLSSITSPSGGAAPTSSYFYGADSNLLIEDDPGQDTLFLPDEQIVLNTATQTLSGTRYYTIGSTGTSTSSGTTGDASDSSDASSSSSAGGGTTASNAASSSGGGGGGSSGGSSGASGGSGGASAAGSEIGSAGSVSGGGATVACRTSAGKVYFLVGDQQGTAGLSIDSSDVTGTGITRRYYDPYGNQVGFPPANWPGNKGFVGGTLSTATGLTNLGAREYQPQSEEFISPDPLLNPYDPQDLNGFAYSGDNPATDSDPTGQSSGPSGGCAYEHFTGDSCSNLSTSANPGDFLAGLLQSVYSALTSSPQKTPGLLQMLGVSTPQLPSRLPLGNPNSGLYKSGDIFGFILALFSGDDGSDDGALASAADGDSAGAGETSNAAAGGCGQSFSSGTKVLLASGKRIPISKIKPGGKVLATNTKTGKTSPETVAAVEVNHDTDLYNLNVKTSGHDTVIHTTSNHLFWVPSLKQWVPAAKLKKGERLKTSGGMIVIADGGIRPKSHDGLMWDLTIPGNNDHDFYIWTVASAVLVHNSNGDCPTEGEGTGSVVNAAGETYPNVIDPRTGEPIPAPPSGLKKVPVSERVSWGGQERGAYIKQWYDEGYSTPKGGWSQYDIHHIIPREYGGTNNFDNLVPVLRSVHQQEFNPWWMNYGG